MFAIHQVRRNLDKASMCRLTREDSAIDLTYRHRRPYLIHVRVVPNKLQVGKPIHRYPGCLPSKGSWSPERAYRPSRVVRHNESASFVSTLSCLIALLDRCPPKTLRRGHWDSF